jgi:hemolysin activation/secretion protein
MQSFANALAVMATCSMLLAGSASAQSVESLRPNRPAGQQLLPEVAIEPEDAGSVRLDHVLPPPPEFSRAPEDHATTAYVEAIEFSGNTAFSDAELTRLAEPFIGRAINREDLRALRDLITLAYVEAGFVASGARLPTQTIEDGVLVIEVVEASVDEVVVRSPPGRLREGYVASRLATLTSKGPLNLNRLSADLYRLREQMPVSSIDAQLQPGANGGTQLALELAEQRPLTFGGGISNHVSPSLGSILGEVDLRHINLTGWGDTLRAGLRVAPGLEAVDGSYEFPIGADGTSVGIFGRYATSEVVEAPFDQLDLTGKASTVEAHVRLPITRAYGGRLDLTLSLAHRNSESFIFGDPFDFVGGGDNGKYRLTVLRQSLDVLRRRARSALALRSTFSLGLPVGASGGGEDGGPDDTFIAWRGQMQWARQLQWRGTELIVRSDVQLSPYDLFSLESFALGGVASVRGFRENQFIRDNGAAVGIEARLPLLSGRNDLQLALFTDGGGAWEKTGESEELWSIGAGLRWFRPHLTMELYWGHNLTGRPDAIDNSLQDEGIHFWLRSSR